ANSNGTTPKEYTSTDTGVIQVGEKYYKKAYYTTVSGYTDDTGETICEYTVLGTYNSSTQSVIPFVSKETTEKYTQSMYIKDGENYVLRYYIPREGNAVYVEDYNIGLNAANGTATMTPTKSGTTKEYKLAQDTMFYNSVLAGSKKITLDSSTVSMKIENDYLMRSLIVQKTVAGVPDATPFTMYIVRADGQSSDFITNETKYTVNGTEKNVKVVTLRYADELNGTVSHSVQAIELKLKADETAIFHDIDLKGTSYSLYEKYEDEFPPLFDGKDGRIYAASASATVGTIPLAGPTALRMKLLSDSPNEILNGDDDFILIGKLYTGITNVDTYKKPISLQLSIGGDGFTPIPVNLTAAQNQYTDNGTSHPIIAISSSSNTAPPITNGMIENLVYTDKVIVNLKELYYKLNDSGQTLPDSYEDVKFYATETKIDGNVISDTAPYYTFKDGVTYIVIRSEDEKQSISGDINSHNVSLMNNISTYTNEHVVYKRIAKASTTTDDVNPTTPLKFCITDTYGEPASGISYVAVYNGTQYTAGTSDENGEISISIKTGEKGWSTTDGVSSYKFALYFSKQVAIKDGAYTIKEIPNADWGTLVGYEAYGDTADKKVCKAVLAEGTQWDTRGETSDTFVNTLEKTEMEVYKHVNHPEPDSTDTNKYPNGVNDAAYIADHTAWEAEKTVISNTIFTYDIKQLIDGTAVPANPDIAYDVYNIVSDGNGGYKKTGEKLNAETLYTKNGQFTLKDGQMAVLKVARYAQWQITEEQHGTYKLIEDNNGDIINDEAFYSDTAANAKGAQIIGTGFKIGSDTGDIYEPPTIVFGTSVILVRAGSKNTQFLPAVLFAYTKSDAFDTINSTGFFNLSGSGYNKVVSSSSGADFRDPYKTRMIGINDATDVDYIYSSDGTTLIWTKNSGTTATKDTYISNSYSTSYLFGTSSSTSVTIPEYVVFHHTDGTTTNHKIEGIGTFAYGSNANADGRNLVVKEITIPATVKTIGHDAFTHATSLEKVTFNITDVSDLTVIGDLGIKSTATIYFPNLTQVQATGATWYSNVVGSNTRIVYFKDTPPPQPTSPKPHIPTQQAAILPTSYSEKRREYPVSA
ncbi:MAG: hypothetical protein IKP69_11840, partial [Oscillospiraceae bacterium]|nr:hypothetical protein [Oscillospiraceae bacterium]